MTRQPLTLLVGLATAVSAVWSVVQPPLAAPTERAQVAYAQALAETGDKPSARTGTAPVSSEQRRYEDVSGATALLAGAPFARPAWSAADRAARDRLASPATARDDGTGPNPAAVNPLGRPALDALAYRAARAVGLSFGGSLVAMRIVSIALFAAALVLVWILAAELFGSALWPRTLAVATVALLPSIASRAGSVDAEPLLLAEFTAVLLLAVRIVRRGPSVLRVASIVAVLMLAVVTNSRGLALAPVVLLALGLGVRRHRPPWRRLVLAAGAALVPLAGGVVLLRASFPGAETAYGGDLGRVLGGHVTPLHALSLAWQEYLPALPFMNPHPAPHGPLDGITAGLVEPLGASFGGGVRGLAFLALAGLAALSGSVVWARRRVLRAQWDTAAVLLGAPLCLLVAAHVIRPLHVDNGAGGVVPLGELLLPLTALLGLAVGFVCAALPRRTGVPLAATLLGAMAALHAGALVSTLERLHA